jgi:phosphoesterase RecJ-like protein
MKVDIASAREQVVQELRMADKFLLTTHENPDGDALGSLAAMNEILTQLGKDCVMFMSLEEYPLPYEYQDLPLDGVAHDLPDDAADRTIVFLDCGNIDRMPVSFLGRDGAHIVNIDHHHDNTNFGTANLVVDGASCTAEIVHELAHDLGAEITPEIADSLYVGLVTDTGKFMYENTTPESHKMAAELIECGVDPHLVFRRLFESMPFAKVHLLAQVLARTQRYDEGRLTISFIKREDFIETGADENDVEGIVDHMRAVRGTIVGALVREQLKEGREGISKVSLRASSDDVDVSRIARLQGGGGHRQAAGFSTELPPDELVAFLRREIAAGM